MAGEVLGDEQIPPCERARLCTADRRRLDSTMPIAVVIRNLSPAAGVIPWGTRRQRRLDVVVTKCFEPRDWDEEPKGVRPRNRPQ